MLYLVQGYGKSRAYFGNTGHKVAENPRWDARPLQGTIHKHTHKFTHGVASPSTNIFLGSGRKPPWGKQEQ